MASSSPSEFLEGVPEDERSEASQLHLSASRLRTAIENVLVPKNELSFTRSKEWIHAFSNKPVSWGASLYLAFPPAGVPPTPPDIQFFALNILLKKIRSDWVQLTPTDSLEIYQALKQSLTLALDATVRSRLCIAIAAAASVAGVDACYQLFEEVKSLDYSLCIELLTALAEEVLHRSRSVHWEVAECFQESYPLVMDIIQRRITLHDDQNISPSLLANTFTCFSRWQRAGITLTELCNDYPALFTSLLTSLGSPHSQLQEIVVEVLTNLVEEVDLLPGREQAVSATISGALAHRDKGQALAPLVSAFGTAEPMTVVRGEFSLNVLQWLVELTSSGSQEQGRERRVSAMAAEAWPRISNIPLAKRASTINSHELFSLVLKALMLSSSFSDDPELDMDDDDFVRFREGSAPLAFSACCSELGSTYWSILSARISQSTSWQEGEVCIFATVSASEEILHATGITPSQKQFGQNLSGEDVKNSAIEFVGKLFSSLPYYTSIMSKDTSQLLQIQLVSTALSMIEKFSPYCTQNTSALEFAVMYSIGCLYIPHVRRKAAASFQSLCRVASTTMANPQTFISLFSYCEKAASISSMDNEGEGGDAEEEDEEGEKFNINQRSSNHSVRLSVIKAMTLLAIHLPLSDSHHSLAQLYSPSLSRIQLYLTQQFSDLIAKRLKNDILIIAGIISTISKPYQEKDQNQNDHVLPAGSEKSQLILTIVQACWPTLTQVASTMTQSSLVMDSLCSVWGEAASSLGLQIASALPEIINSASHLFALHKHSSSLDCLSSIVRISSGGSEFQPDIEAKLTSIPQLLVQALPSLHQLLSSTSSPLPTKKSHSLSSQVGMDMKKAMFVDASEDAAIRIKNTKIHEEISDTISSLWILCRSFVQNSPNFLVPSPSFLPLIENAHKYLWPWDFQISPNAAYFLVDVIFGKPIQPIDKIPSWQIPGHLRSAIEQLIPVISTPIIKSCLLAAGKGYLENPDNLAPIADVLYSLCSLYPSVSKQALLSTLSPSLSPSSSSSSPSRSLFKRGALSQKDVEIFVETAIQQSQTRLRFHDLICDYSKVAKGLVPAQAFESYL